MSRGKGSSRSQERQPKRTKQMEGSDINGHGIQNI